MEQDGATQKRNIPSMLLKDMVGPCGLEPQTSTVSKIWKTHGKRVMVSAYQSMRLAIVSANRP
jgi:hypothetical protein